MALSASRCVTPITAFNGVRISWLMLERKALLAALAASAAALASCKASLVRRHSVLSWNAPTTRRGPLPVP